MRFGLLEPASATTARSETRDAGIDHGGRQVRTRKPGPDGTCGRIGRRQRRVARRAPAIAWRPRADLCRLVRTGLRAMIHWTYARHRIRHGIRHASALAGRGLRPCVSNGRLRHTLIGYARVLKADGSQSLDLQRDALRAEGVDAALTGTAEPASDTPGTRHRTAPPATAPR